jgi:hypothetical protein
MQMPSRRVLAAYSLAVFLASPFVVTFHYHTRWQRGDYPVNADSIGLPIIGYLILVLPVFLVLLCVGIRRFKGQVSLFSWNTQRWGWSLIWTLVFVFLSYQSAMMMIDAVQGRLLFSFIFFAVQIHVLSLLRASAVS